MFSIILSIKKYICIILMLSFLMAFSIGCFMFALAGRNQLHPVMNRIEDEACERITVIIDPGHGGIDGGAVGQNGTVEKIINLRIARYLKELCIFSDIDCVLTRNDDNLLVADGEGSGNVKRSDLIARTKIASMYDNAVFVSIHQNKFDNSRYSGMQVFYSKNNERSRMFAEMIKETNIRMLSPDNKREIKPAGSEIYILDNIDIPAVLVECGFLSNADEAKLLNSEEYQRKIAFVIYASVMQFLYGGNNIICHN